ncbi:MAG: GatB/YqeY domain-containing protein [Anaerolineae bacterium]
MSLREKLQKDLQEAMRARDVRRKAALRVLLASIQTREAEQGPLSDDEILRLIEKEVKQREEALEMAQEAGRTDIVAPEKEELEILRAYLPEPLSEEALVALVEEVIEDVGATSMADMGRVMQTIMPQVRGRADGSQVNRLVRERLS